MSSVFKNSSQTSVSNSTINSVGGDQHNYKVSFESRPTLNHSVLEALKPADRDVYNIMPCMEGTRESVLKDVRSWLDDFGPETPNVMLISGSPGAGKSAIASTLVSELSSPGSQRLGSYFFFKRGDANLSNPAALWRTVASDLVRFNQGIHSSIVECLEKPGFRPGEVHSQFDALIKHVLVKHADTLKRNSPVIIIDALDECGSYEVQKDRDALLKTIEKWSDLPSWLKLIITSRDERLTKFFYGDLCFYLLLETGDSTGPETSKDIYQFFKKSFSDLAGLLCLDPEWPGELKLQQLTARTAGLFIWAKTAVEFLLQDEDDDDPNIKMGYLLSGNTKIVGQNLDSLYQQVLEYAFSKSTDSRLQLLRAILGSIVLAKAPLYIDDLKYFVSGGQNEWHINVTVQRLSSVISKRNSDGLLQLRHLSFGEYITDSGRCMLPQFYVDQNKHNYQMATACFRLMNSALKFNICNLETSHYLNSDFPDLPQRIRDNIPYWLQYSCLFLGSHLTACSKDKLALLHKELEQWLFEKFLYWLEVMSLLNSITNAAWILENIAKAIKEYQSPLKDFVKDAAQFIAHFQIPLEDSVPHIYLSALPFSPEMSQIRKHFLPKFQNTLSITKGLQIFWPVNFKVLAGHTNSTTAVAYSFDGKQVVSGSWDKTIRIWDIETGQTVAGPFEGHTKPVTAVAYSPNGEQIVSGSDDKTVRIWDVKVDHKCTKIFEGHTNRVTTVAYSPDGKNIVSGSWDKTVRIWDIETGKIVAGPFNGHINGVTAVAYSPNGKQIISGSWDETIRMWEVKTGQIALSPFEGHTNWVTSVAYSPDGKQVASGSDDKTIRIWDVNTGQTIAGPFKGHTNWVTAVAFSPDGKNIVSGSNDKTVRIWDTRSGKTVAGPFEGHTNPVTSVAYSPDGKQVVSGSWDKTVRVWDIETGQIVASPFEGHTNKVTDVAYSPDGKYIVSSSDDQTVRVWNIETSHTASDPFEGHKNRVSAVTYSPNGKQIVSGSWDRTIRIWDAETGQTINGPLEGHMNPITAIAYSPNGKQVASGSDDKTVRIWDIETSQIVVCLFEGHKNQVTAVAYSPNGKQVASGSWDETIRIWDIETGQLVAGPLEGHTNWVTAVAYSPNGKQVASGSDDKTIRIWDVETGQTIVGPFEGHTNWVTAVAYSPDGKRIASGSWDKTIRIWDVGTGRKIAGPFEGHTNGVTSLAYSPDGKYIVSGSNDKTIRIWNVETKQTDASLYESHKNLFRVATHFSNGIQAVSKKKSHSIEKSWTDSILTSPIDSFKDKSIGDHIKILNSIGGPNVFASDSRGWSYCNHGVEVNSLCYWKPIYARETICDGIAIKCFGGRTIHIDFSRFVHGTSWTECKQGA